MSKNKTRETKDSAAGLPTQIKFEQLLSPGLLIHRSLGKSPFNFTFGFQMNPKLREIKQSDLSLVFQNTTKFYIGIIFDLPFYNLYKRR